VGLIAHYDSRDNIFTPNTGHDFSLTGSFYDPALGGDSSWQNFGYKLHSYHQVHP
jgi:outer membrane protein assembly factor BamA